MAVGRLKMLSPALGRDMASAATMNVKDDLELSESPAGPCVMIVFGAAGDLTTRKLVPALYNLAKQKLLPENFAVVGVSVDDLNNDQFRVQATRFLDKEDHSTEAWQWFNERLFYLRGDFANPDTFTSLSERLGGIDKQYGTEGNYLFYLATAPKFFAEIVQQLGAIGLAAQENGHWRRVVIEKPFGHDLESARGLNAAVQGVLS